MNSTVLFSLIAILGGGMLLHKTLFKNYSVEKFWSMFIMAEIGCAFVFALPWALHVFFNALP